ncbi:MAG: UDP-N-acetylmuramoyl-tripeptide--D-alanyl-D-alanine ligase, partial [Xanthomonadales bacterium]|nr:UDP-N-acetylmuramoyl-tripeptide--D-alanyl-D-alanine ligase [Xanthomonadales bacterium]
FGVSAHADVRLVDENGESRLETPAGPIELRLALPGRHNRINAAAAAAVAIELGVDSAAIRTGLAAVKPVPGRLNLLRTQPGWTVIDDTYNANPASLYSALRVLSDLQGTAWLVLGDMKELGGGSHKMHREVGEAAKVMGVARLFATGEMTVYTVDSFGEGAEHFESRDALIAALLEQLRPGVNCLVKGSRSMGMEAVVEAIARRPGMREAS